MAASGHFLKLQSAKFAPLCGARVIWKSNSVKHQSLGPFLRLRVLFAWQAQQFRQSILWTSLKRIVIMRSRPSVWSTCHFSGRSRRKVSANIFFGTCFQNGSSRCELLFQGPKPSPQIVQKSPSTLCALRVLYNICIYVSTCTIYIYLFYTPQYRSILYTWSIYLAWVNDQLRRLLSRPPLLSSRAALEEVVMSSRCNSAGLCREHDATNNPLPAGTLTCALASMALRRFVAGPDPGKAFKDLFWTIESTMFRLNLGLPHGCRQTTIENTCHRKCHLLGNIFSRFMTLSLSCFGWILSRWTVTKQTDQCLLFHMFTLKITRKYVFSLAILVVWIDVSAL